jgi:predicted MPP superfamily phosphohydrolase
MIVKKKYLKKRYKFLIAVTLLISILLLWSRYISTSGLEIKEYKVTSSNLPTTFVGMKIVHFTDIHYGRTIDKNDLDYFVNEVNVLKPDLIFFTGDLVDKDTKLTSKIKNDIINSLSKLNATIGKYAVSGNHDIDNSEYQNILSDSGFNNLNNNFDIIYSKGYESILVAGLESEVKGHPNTNNLNDFINAKDGSGNNINIVPKYKILLLHTPDTINKLKNYNFNLVLAGHSHNGQVRLPFIGSVITPIGSKEYHEAYYKINKTDLYISGGLGTSTISFRFLNKPSFNFYRLANK